MPAREHDGLHDQQIRAIWELVHDAKRLGIEIRRDLRDLNAGIKRIEAAAASHTTTKRTKTS